MAQQKLYKLDPEEYEKKLARVMERFGIPESDYDWNYDRRGAHVWFRYKGEVYRFEYTVAQAKERGEKMQYGSDAFSRVVLTLEDLARMIERGIYDLSTWVKGMLYLPEATKYPEWVKQLGLTTYPASPDQVAAQYKEQAKATHPDAGGSPEAFITLGKARDDALSWLKEQAKHDG